MPSSQCLLQEKMKCLRGVKLLAFPGLLTQAACIFLCFGWDVLGSEWWGSQVTHQWAWGLQRPQHQDSALAIVGWNSVSPYREAEPSSKVITQFRIVFSGKAVFPGIYTFPDLVDQLLLMWSKRFSERPPSQLSSPNKYILICVCTPIKWVFIFYYFYISKRKKIKPSTSWKLMGVKSY